MVHQVDCVFTACGKCQLIAQLVDMALLRLVHQVSCVCVRSVTQHVDMAVLQLVHQVG